MPTDPRLAALPALRAYAEEEARALRAPMVAKMARYDHVSSELDLSAGILDRLTDLSRPASRDAVARLVAERLGLEVGATAPGLTLYTFNDSPSHWAIGDRHPNGRRHVFHEDEPLYSGRFSTRVVGISGITDPAEALTLIALHTLGGSSGR